MKKSSIILICLLISLCSFAKPQEAAPKQTQHIFEFAAQGGVSGLLYKSACGYMAPSFNTGASFNYIYRSPHHVGFRVGLGAEGSQSIFTAKDYQDTYMATDLDDDPIEIRYHIDRTDEKHTSVYFSVPFQLALFGNNFSFYIGPKVALPLASWSRGYMYNSTLEVYYPQYDALVNNSVALTAGNVEKQFYSENHAKYLPKIWVMLSADMVYDIKINKYHSLGIGLYADYALNNAKVAATDNLSLQYISDMHQQFPVTRQVESVLKANYQGGQLIESLGYFSAGLKIRIKVWE